MSELRDWVVVSGAGGALGADLAIHYANKGLSVLGLDRRLDRLQADKVHGGIVPRAIDLCAERDVQQVLDEVLGEDGQVGLLINAVGQIWNEPIISLRANKFVVHSVDNWRQVTDSNLTAPFIVATLVAARMVRSGGGSIVNFSSIASDGNPGQVAYGAAKAGIEGLTR